MFKIVTVSAHDKHMDNDGWRSHPIYAGGSIKTRSGRTFVNVYFTVSAFGKKTLLDNIKIYIELSCSAVEGRQPRRGWS